MRKVATCINESQAKILDRKLEQLNMSEYEFLKSLLISALEPSPVNNARVKHLLREAFAEAIAILDNAP